jgi:hypothetical protein
MDLETVYLGRDNAIVRQLLQDGAPPAAGITKVQARIGSVCLDTDTDADITHTDGVVTLVLGKQSLPRGLSTCALTVYDGAHPDGLAWDSFYVYVRDWAVCA